MAARDDDTPSRRRLMKFTAAAAAGAGVTGTKRAAAAPGADAELLALCAEWHRAEDRFAEATEAREVALGRATDPAVRMARGIVVDPDRALWRAIREAENAEGELRDRIHAVRATTVAGLVAKAGVVQRVYRSDPGFREVAAELDQTTLGLLPDLAALAGGAA